ncbi:hypothetical protein [Citrobacter koseri]|uniref:hypothetical protein n=1 Tax=Citrobacter koseri TaxID=545 RepID=UPI000D86C387|nr:hypothetical protein [Citrobacter koseri]PWY09412.1 hypothetical protein DL345_07155 [Citrobacter koseri]PWY16302.1 hypothetical protein DL345_00490 [Citrobacter koseri]
MTIDKQALRKLATDAHELGIIKRYSKGLEAQRKFYAAATPLVIRALLDEVEALQSFRTAFNEWHDKTEWVQTDKRLDVIKPWGKHRADVLKLYIDHLESKLEAKEEQRANWFQMAQKLGEDLDAAEKCIAELREWNAGLAQESFERQQHIAELSGQKRLIGWRASDYTDETSDPELAKNWAAAIGVLPIFEGDVNTKLSAAGIGKGE